MSLPTSAPSVPCSLSKPLLAEGSAGIISSAFLSVDRVLVWAASGETIYSDPVKVVPSPDTGDLAFDVVPTDVEGMLDAAGNMVTNWVYTLKVSLDLSTGSSKTVNYVFQPKTTDEGGFDVDLVPQTGAVSDPPATVSGSEVTINVGDSGTVALIDGGTP